MISPQSQAFIKKLEVWEGMFYVFPSVNPLLPEGRDAIQHMADFMRAC